MIESSSFDDLNLFDPCEGNTLAIYRTRAGFVLVSVYSVLAGSGSCWIVAARRVRRFAWAACSGADPVPFIHFAAGAQR